MTNAPDQEAVSAFLKIAVNKGLIDLEAADYAMRESTRTHTNALDILQNQGLMTPAQIARVRKEVERAQGPLIIAGHRVVATLGRGGMGVVYQALQKGFERDIALKVMHDHLARDPAFAERFLREAQLSGKVNHPHVVTVYETGRDGDVLYLAMEFIAGGDAEHLLRASGGRLPPRRALEIVRDAARGLTAIHRTGLVHRDIKPANIFLTADGMAKLADLGLTRHADGGDRLSLTGVILGTPAFMSPEQATGLPIDIRTDIYALGATLYTLVTGTAPYAGTNSMSIAVLAAKGPFPDPLATLPTLPASVAALIRRATAQRAEDRHQIPADLVADLDRVLADPAMADTAPTMHPPLGASPAASLLTVQTPVAAASSPTALVIGGTATPVPAAVHPPPGRPDPRPATAMTIMAPVAPPPAAPTPAVANPPPAANPHLQVRRSPLVPSLAVAAGIALLLAAGWWWHQQSVLHGARDAVLAQIAALPDTAADDAAAALASRVADYDRTADAGGKAAVDAAWQQRQDARRAALRNTLGALDDSAHPPAIAAGAGLEDALGRYAKLCAPGDPDLVRWRSELGSWRVEMLYRSALAMTDVDQMKKTLVKAAMAGHLGAAARMIQLGMWDDMAAFDPGQPPVSTWGATSATARLPDPSAPALSGAIVQADFRANWATRHKLDVPKAWQDHMRAARAVLLDQAESCGEPIMLSELSWLCSVVEPHMADRADAARRHEEEIFTPDAMARMGDRLHAAAIAHNFATSFHEAGLLDKAVDWEGRAADCLGQAGDRRGQGSMLDWEANWLEPEHNPAGDWAKAEALYAQAADCFGQAGDLGGQSNSLMDEAQCLEETTNPVRDVVKAAALWAQAGDLGAQTGDLEQERSCLYHQGTCLSPVLNPPGDWAKAVAVFAQAADASGKAGDGSLQGESLYEQARCLDRNFNPAGDWAKAVALYTQAAALQSDNPDEQSNSLYNLALCLQPDKNPAGDWNRAAALFAQAADLSGKAGNRYQQGNSLFFQARCLDRNFNPSGDWAKAVELYTQAADVLSISPDDQSMALFNLAMCLQPDKNPDGDWNRAAALYAQAADVRIRFGKRTNPGLALKQQAWCLQPDRNVGGDWNQAAALYAQAADWSRKNNDIDSQAFSLHMQAFCLIKGRKEYVTDAIRALFLRAAQLYRQTGDEAAAQRAEGWTK